MSKVFLETERLVLREVDADDAAVFFDIDSDPEVMKFLSGGAPSALADCEKAIERITTYYDKFPDQFGLWIASEKTSGECIGWFLLRPERNQLGNVENPELGYRLKKKFWGHGFATEVSFALVAMAFTEFNCTSVFADTMVGNLGSQNVMKKMGMVFEKSFQHEDCFAPGNDHSAVRYRITKETWLTRGG